MLYFVQNHRARKWQGRDLNPGTLVLEPSWAPYHYSVSAPSLSVHTSPDRYYSPIVETRGLRLTQHPTNVYRGPRLDTDRGCEAISAQLLTPHCLPSCLAEMEVQRAASWLSITPQSPHAFREVVPGKPGYQWHLHILGSPEQLGPWAQRHFQVPGSWLWAWDLVHIWHLLILSTVPWNSYFSPFYR